MAGLSHLLCKWQSLAIRSPRSCLPFPSHGSENLLGQLSVGTMGSQGFLSGLLTAPCPWPWGFYLWEIRRACASPAFLFFLKKRSNVDTDYGEELLEQNVGEEEEGGDETYDDASGEREEGVSTS